MPVLPTGTFTFNIPTEDLAKGLRPTRSNPRNVKFLTECNGAVGIDNVLQVLKDMNLDHLIDVSALTFAFPYPQLFVFTDMILVCTQTKIYEYTHSSPGTLTLKITVDPGILWSAVDFHDYIYMSNCTTAVVRHAEDGSWEEIFSEVLPPHRASCNYNGQVVISPCAESIPSEEEGGNGEEPPTPPEEGSFKGLIPIEMVSTWLFDDEFDVTWTVTEREIDPDDYPGLTASYFEAIADNHYGEVDHHLLLVDEDGNTCADITAVAGSRLTRYRVPCTLSLLKKKYYVKTLAQTEDEMMWLDFSCVRILLELEDSARIRVQIPMASGDWSTGAGQDNEADDNLWAWYGASSSPDWGFSGYFPDWWPTTNRQGESRIKLTKTNWSTIDHWTFEVIGCIYNGAEGATADYCIWNVTKDAMVAGTEINISSDTPIRVTVDFLDSATNWDDGDEFEVRFKRTGDAVRPDYCENWIYTANIYATVDPATKAEVYLRVSTYTEGYASGVPLGPIGSDTRYNKEARWKWESDKFPVNSPVFFEETAQESGDGSPHLYLFDAGIADANAFTYSFEATGAIGTATSPKVVNNPLNVLGQEYAWADCTLDTPGEECTIEASGFDYSAIAGKQLGGVEINCIGHGPNPQPALISIYSSAGGSKTQLITSTDPVAWGFQGITIMALPTTVTVKGAQPANSTPTTFYWDYIVVVVTVGVPLPPTVLDFSLSEFERQRTADVSGDIVDGNCYVTYVSASVGNNISLHTDGFLIVLVDTSV